MSDCKNCEHINHVIDEHEGTNVCLDCGLVIDNQIFFDNIQNINDEHEIKYDSYKEFLTRLQLTDSHIEELRRIEKKNESLSSIACNIYLTVNQTSSVTLKEVISATGASEKKIVKQTRGHVTCLDKIKLLDKYCQQLNLPFKNYTVIKEQLETVSVSGHNPLTIIASCIYIHCKTNKLKISMRKISEVIGISCISIQRFLKKTK